MDFGKTSILEKVVRLTDGRSNDMFPFHSPSRVGWEDPFHPSSSGFLGRTDFPIVWINMTSWNCQFHSPGQNKNRSLTRTITGKKKKNRIIHKDQTS